MTFFINFDKIFEYIDLNRFSKIYVDYGIYLKEIIRYKISSNEIVNIEDLNDFLDNFNDSNEDYQRNTKSVKSLDAVKIANVHKVKGLQAPVVILACDSCRNNSASEYKTEVNGKKEFYLFKLSEFVDGKNTEYLSTTQYDNLLSKANASEFDESLRLLYVAATRPESVLIITDCEPTEKSIGVWHLLVDENTPMFEEKDTNCEIVLKQNDEKMNNIKENIKSQLNICKKNEYRIFNPSKIKITKDVLLKDVALEEDKVFTNANEKSKALKGTIIHRMMELIGNTKAKININQIIKVIKNEYKDEKEFIKSLGDIYERIINNKLVENNFDVINEIKEAKMVFCEVPFACIKGDSLYYGIMDLVYEDKYGQYHIVDYKSNYESDVKKLEEDYKGQLDAYKKAFKIINGIDADARIYHIN